MPPRDIRAIRVRRRAWVPLLIAYAASFLVPTISLPYDAFIPGYRVFYKTLVMGFGRGVPPVIGCWSANPLFLAGVACLAAGRVGRAAALGLAAFGAALFPVRIFAEVVGKAIESHRLIELAKGPGYFAWLGSMAGLAVVAGYLAGRDGRGRFRPRPGLGHLMYAVGVAAFVTWGVRAMWW